jgi:hypothetical protein
MSHAKESKDLAAPITVWDYHLAPDVVKQKAAFNGDDVDFLMWVPEHFEGNTFFDMIEQNGQEIHWEFWFEEGAQNFLGPHHRGDGFLVTVTHA